MAILLKDENSASEAFVRLIQACPTALHLFLRLALSNLTSIRQFGTGCIIEHLHSTDKGREIDILLHKDRQAIIVECKVEDRRKPYQFKPYRDYWLRRGGNEPHLVWLVKWQQTVLGDGSNRAKVITWNELHDALVLELNHCSTIEKQLIETFCRDLINAQITVATGKSLMRCTIRKGYHQDHALHILSAIRDKVGHLDGSVEEINGLPPALHVGRKTWINKLEDGWIKRLRFIMLPYTQARNRIGPYSFRGNVRLYASDEGADLDYVLSHLSQWGRVCNDAGLEFRRNIPGKWNEQTEPELIFPFSVGTRLNYLFAREPVKEAMKHSQFDWRNDDEAISLGCRRLEYFLSLIDKFE